MLTSEEFEKKLKLCNYEELEREFKETKQYFENLQDKIKVDEIQKKYPVDCYDQRLGIKYPTYKIRIINNKLRHTEIKEFLGDIGEYCICNETKVVLTPFLEPVKCTDIHCLEIGLELNTKLADNIEGILKKRNIDTERWIDFAYYTLSVTVDEEGYVTINNK